MGPDSEERGLGWDDGAEGTLGRGVRCRVPMFGLICANAFSWTGDVAVMVSLPWFVLETTGSAAKTGLTGAALGIGTVVAGVFGGPLVDRLGFKRTSVLADLLSGATVALVPLLYWVGALEFWSLVVLVFTGSALDTPGASARIALIPRLAEQAEMPLERANSAFGAIPRLALLIGPPLAGVLVVALGAAAVLLLDAATFAVSAILVALLVPSSEGSGRRVSVTEVPAGGQGGSGRGYRRYLTELSEGVRFVRGVPLIFSLLLVFMMINLLDDPLVSVVLPVYAEAHWGSAAGLGIVIGAVGAGALAGTALYGTLGHRLPRLPVLVVSLAASAAIELCALLATLPVAATAVMFGVAGFLMGSFDPISSTVLQERVPQRMLGRVFGLTRALAMAGTPLGLALGGFLVEGLGLTAALIGLAGSYGAVTFGMLVSPALREMDVPLKDSRDRSAQKVPDSVNGPLRS